MICRQLRRRARTPTCPGRTHRGPRPARTNGPHLVHRRLTPRRRSVPSCDIMRYQEVAIVADVLIRNVPEDVLAAIDRKAERAGLSRSEYLRRALTRERTAPAPVTLADLDRLSVTAADLADDEVMGR